MILPVVSISFFLFLYVVSGLALRAMEEREDPHESESCEARAVKMVIGYAEDQCERTSTGRVFGLVRTLSQRRNSGPKQDPVSSRPVVGQLTTCLHEACARGNVDEVKKLIKNGEKMDTTNSDGELPIHVAARLGYIEIVKQFYYHDSALLTVPDRDTGAVINIVCKYGHLDLLKWLCDKVTINMVGKNGNRALHQAVIGQHVRIVSELLLRGADLFSVNDAGQTPLDVAKCLKNESITSLISRRSALLDQKKAQRATNN